jgi:hypothetical protein
MPAELLSPQAFLLNEFEKLGDPLIFIISTQLANNSFTKIAYTDPN